VVLSSGSALAVNFAAEHAAALLENWYGGEEAGNAIAETLAGKNNPAGRLPVTFYRSVNDLPPFEDYAMRGRTYRYFTGNPLYAFGFGLNYSLFQYSDLQIESVDAQPAHLHVIAKVKNTSTREGDEVVQLYVSHDHPSADEPLRELRGFQRIHLAAGETKPVEFDLDVGSLGKNAARKLHISIGSGQPVNGTPHVEGIASYPYN
jgi:beta-glucosidase